MIEVLEKTMRSQADDRMKKMNKLEEKYISAYKKREEELVRQQKELPPPAFITFKVAKL